MMCIAIDGECSYFAVVRSYKHRTTDIIHSYEIEQNQKKKYEKFGKCLTRQDSVP